MCPHVNLNPDTSSQTTSTQTRHLRDTLVHAPQLPLAKPHRTAAQQLFALCCSLSHQAAAAEGSKSTYFRGGDKGAEAVVLLAGAEYGSGTAKLVAKHGFPKVRVPCMLICGGRLQACAACTKRGAGEVWPHTYASPVICGTFVPR